MSAASDIGTGRLLSKRTVISLDRLTPEGWVEIGRFNDYAAASTALDHAVAESGDAAQFRLRSSTAGRLPLRIGLVIVAVAVLVVVLTWIAIR